MYYIIKEAAGTKETGSNYPQIQEMIMPYDYDASNSINKIAYHKDAEIPFDPNFKKLKLMARSKTTDVISTTMLTGSGGLLISEKLKEIFDSHIIVKHKYYPVIISHKGIELNNYHYLHLISDLRGYINYKSSRFYSRILGYEDNENLSFNNLEETIKFYETIDKYKTLRSEFIVFRDGYLPPYDLFRISKFDQNIYISERLFNSLQKKKVTGIELNPAMSIRDENGYIV